MKRAWLVLFLFSVMSYGYTQTISQQIDVLVTRYVDLNKFNGSVLVAKGGKILLEKGYGFRNIANHTLNNEHTIFQIGSVTKEFTAAVILVLAQQQKLALTDKLNMYFPEFPKGDSITVKNLLTHTSGIFDYTHVAGFMEQSTTHTYDKKVVEFLKNKPLDFSPGEKYSYSNSGYMLLAYIIEKVTNMTYENAVRDFIFKPLKMTRSGFDFSGLNDPDKAIGYIDYSAAQTTEGPAIDSSQFKGSGEIYSTVGDLFKWSSALQLGQILNKTLQQEAYQAHQGPYGYGWQLDSVYNRKMVSHNGGMFGFRSKMLRIPKDNICVILLANDSDDPYVETIAKKILAIMYSYPDTLPAQPVKISEEKLRTYTGTYSFNQNREFEVQLIGGHLFGLSSGRRMELIPLREDYFCFLEKEGGEEGNIEFSQGQMNLIMKDGFKVSAKKIK